jgi:carbonic anhydrase
VASVCDTTTVQHAWEREQPLAVHGWIYSVNDGLLRDLGLCVAGRQELTSAYQAAVVGQAGLLIPAGFDGDVIP